MAEVMSAGAARLLAASEERAKRKDTICELIWQVTGEIADYEEGAAPSWDEVRQGERWFQDRFDTENTAEAILALDVDALEVLLPMLQAQLERRQSERTAALARLPAAQQA